MRNSLSSYEEGKVWVESLSPIPAGTLAPDVM